MSTIRQAGMGALAVLATLAVLGAGALTSTPPLAAVRALAARLGSSGRAVAQFERRASEFVGASAGRLTLEPPDRLRLDFASGERLALRADGGEWIQPAAEQMVRLRAEQVEAAAGYWEVLLGAGAADFRERPAGRRSYLLVPLDAGDGAADSVRIELDTQGLPARLVAWTAGDSLDFRLSGWRFSSPRGAAAFKLAAPSGYEVVDLP